jgi:hypothetical protein
MANKQNNKWLLIGLGVVLLTAVISIIYGQGYINLGAFGINVKRVAEATCKKGADLEDKYCVYNLEPIQYFVMKDGDNYVIYGDNITTLFQENALNIAEGSELSAISYSLMRPAVNTKTQIASTPFSSLSLGFKTIDNKGHKIPAISMDNTTATRSQGARFVEVELPKMIKVRLNSFYLP